MSVEHRMEFLRLQDKKYYFIQFESDVQIIFDEISKTKDVSRISVNILKGNIHLKGDYFIPLKSADTIRLCCDELMAKLKTISCVLNVEVDSNHNLTFHLNRSMVYKAVLEEVMSQSEQYGTFKVNKSVLVLTYQEKSKSLENLRNNLLAEHIVSVLANNGVEVFHNDFKSDYLSEVLNSTALVCTNECNIAEVCKSLQEKIHTCEYKTDSDDNKTCLDAKRFIEGNNLCSTYGNALTSIILLRENVSEDLSKTSYVTHLIRDHMRCVPDVIIHVASQGQNRSTFKAGVLLNMLGGYSPRQVYIFSQSVQYRGKCAAVQKDDSCNTLQNKDMCLSLQTDVGCDAVQNELRCCIQNTDNDAYTSYHEIQKDSAVNGFIDCQTEDSGKKTANQGRYKGTAKAFMEAHYTAVENATSMKYPEYDDASEEWSSRIQHLADAAVKFDVLRPSHGSVLALRPPTDRDGEKTFGVFVQYNFARISNLFLNFELKVEDGTYDPLCALEDADFDLLEAENEWRLFYYVLTFPQVVEGVLRPLVAEEGGRNQVRLNRMCLMLQELCQGLSLYYGRVRILGGQQHHLQKVMNARIWILRGIHRVFQNSFKMLNIKGLDLM